VVGSCAAKEYIRLSDGGNGMDRRAMKAFRSPQPRAIDRRAGCMLSRIHVLPTGRGSYAVATNAP
jgi:hypothetical protein